MVDRIALTVDLEPDWGLRGSRAYCEVTFEFLRFLTERNMRATFFIVSDLLDVSAEPASAIAERNEVGSHGRSHRLLSSLRGAEIDRELSESRDRLCDLGDPVFGFRAPFFRRCRDFGGRLLRAGYVYDASLGTVVPGPVNGRLHRLRCPSRREGLYEFPTSAMCGGLAPLSLTWLRLLAPLSLKQLPGSASLIYLHLHEFLPAETARCLPLPLRRVLTRNCGEKAWGVLDEALGALGAEYVSCADILASVTEDNGKEPVPDV